MYTKPHTHKTHSTHNRCSHECAIGSKRLMKINNSLPVFMFLTIFKCAVLLQKSRHIRFWNRTKIKCIRKTLPQIYILQYTQTHINQIVDITLFLWLLHLGNYMFTGPFCIQCIRFSNKYTLTHKYTKPFNLCILKTNHTYHYYDETTKWTASKSIQLIALNTQH